MAGRRPEHAFLGEVGGACYRCLLEEKNHRPKRKREDDRDRKGRKQVREKRKQKVVFFGVDGEGQGRQDHKYVLLAVSNADGSERYHIENRNGLSTIECLDFLRNLPPYVRLFSYSFNYDITKILEQVWDKELYDLARPENRQRHGKDWFKGPRSVPWGKWQLNMQATKFYFRRNEDTRNTIIWDIWKFYQSKFTSACSDWGVGTKEEIKQMQYMKDHRHEFDKMPKEQVLEYCYKETQFMAQLAEKLVDAHNACGLQLKSFFGAGSTASAILKKLDIPKYIAAPPKEMEIPVAMGFFGGRFDNAFIGRVAGPVYSYDISSAYPYQTCQLPCLVHGTWELTQDRERILTATTALVRYENRLVMSTNSHKTKHWGPFPFRMKDGSICYPAESNGWTWRDEFLEGERLFEGVKFQESWVYNTKCDCRPFKDIPQFYIERCLIGKEGPGIVLKLGINSVYGKIAQSIGKAIYRSWVWAGMITSGCRAQVLRALGMHKDWSNLLMIATDGIATREKLDLDKPVDTGTANVWECEKHKKTCYECKDRKYKPLGGWEEKVLERGIFLARPGVYFPLNPSEDDIKTVRGRGVGRGVILQNWKKIIKTLEDWNGVLTPSKDKREGVDNDGWPAVKVSNVARFCGIKTSISRRLSKDIRDGLTYHRSAGDHLDSTQPEPRYGQWIDRNVIMSFNPAPKRAGLEKDGSLTLHRFPGESSAPYRKAVLSPEARALLWGELVAQEQPDYDPADYSANDETG